MAVPVNFERVKVDTEYCTGCIFLGKATSQCERPDSHAELVCVKGDQYYVFKYSLKKIFKKL